MNKIRSWMKEIKSWILNKEKIDHHQMIVSVQIETEILNEGKCRNRYSKTHRESARERSDCVGPVGGVWETQQQCVEQWGQFSLQLMSTVLNHGASLRVCVRFHVQQQVQQDVRILQTYKQSISHFLPPHLTSLLGGTDQFDQLPVSGVILGAISDLDHQNQTGAAWRKCWGMIWHPPAASHPQSKQVSPEEICRVMGKYTTQKGLKRKPKIKAGL